MLKHLGTSIIDFFKNIFIKYKYLAELLMFSVNNKVIRGF